MSSLLRSVTRFSSRTAIRPSPSLLTKFRPQPFSLHASKMSDQSIVFTKNAPAPVGPYSQAIKTPTAIYCSGQIPLTPEGNLLEGSITDKTKQCIANLEAVLVEAGSSIQKVVKVNIFLADMGSFAEMNGEYEKWFTHALSIQRASGSTTKCLGDSNSSASLLKVEDGSPSEEEKRQQSLWFPFGDWLKAQKDSSGQREMESREREMQRSPFLPKITMVGISTGEAAHMSKANLKKTMEDLTQDLEQSDEGSDHGSNRYDPLKIEERDPLFVANVGDYYSGLARAGSARWSRRGDDRNETPPRSS